MFEGPTAACGKYHLKTLRYNCMCLIVAVVEIKQKKKVVVF